MVYANNFDQVNEFYTELKNIPGSEKLVDNLNENWIPNLHQWVKFYRNDLYNRGSDTNNRIERHNKELKKSLIKSDHLVISIQNLIKYAYSLHQNRETLVQIQTLRHAKVHDDECTFMKMYHQEFTSHAVKLIRQQQAIMTTLCENYSR